MLCCRTRDALQQFSNRDLVMVSLYEETHALRDNPESKVPETHIIATIGTKYELSIGCLCFALFISLSLFNSIDSHPGKRSTAPDSSSSSSASSSFSSAFSSDPASLFFLRVLYPASVQSHDVIGSRQYSKRFSRLIPALQAEAQKPHGCMVVTLLESPITKSREFVSLHSLLIDSPPLLPYILNPLCTPSSSASLSSSSSSSSLSGSTSSPWARFQHFFCFFLPS